MVYVLLAEGFEEIEALTPVDILRRAKIPVKTVAVSGNKVTVSTRGVPVIADLAIGDVNLSELDMVVLPGGQPGSDNLYASGEVRRIVSFAYENGKLLAAICAAPLVFGKMGLLDGKKATCYPGTEENLKGADVSLSEGVVRDGRIITARAAGSAADFAFELVVALTDELKAKAIKRAMYF